MVSLHRAAAASPGTAAKIPNLLGRDIFALYSAPFSAFVWPLDQS
jgi:hypothetical protein